MSQRPDPTCRATTTMKPGQKSHRICFYSKKQDQEYICELYDDLYDEFTNNNQTPQDLINKGKYTRVLLWEFFCNCVKFTLSNTEVKCSRCGECCKKFARKQYKSDPNKRCKPDANNPCGQLEGTETPYTCGVYDTDFRQCADYPGGTVYGLFMEVLSGEFFTTWDSGVQKISVTPGCVYEFEREP